jgi:hypothetical protein
VRLKLALQIAAGILIATGILWMVVSMVIGGAALQALADTVSPEAIQGGDQLQSLPFPPLAAYSDHMSLP